MTTDWATPAYGFMRGGVMVHVLASTMTGLEMQRALRRRGIDSWAWAADRGGFSFRVGASQARFARSVLGRMGVVCV
jgi:hypothetical protein